MQHNEAESRSVVTIDNSSQTLLFGTCDSVYIQSQSYAMSQLPVSSIIGDSFNGLPFGHRPCRPSMAVNNNNELMDQLVFPSMSAGNHGYNTSFERANYGCEGLPSRWDFNKFSSPSQELVDRTLAQNGVHPIPWTQSCGLSSSDLGIFSSKELSLSLSMSETPQFMQGPNIQEQQRSEMSSSGETLQNRIVPLDHSSSSRFIEYDNKNLSSSDCNSHRVSPFMAGSRMFLQAMQEILAEIAFCAVDNLEQKAYSSSSSTGTDFSDGGLNGDHRSIFQSNFSVQNESEERQKLLLALLQLVDDTYSQCIDEIHTVVSAFHAVTELDPNLHARFVLPTISFMCKNLREKISNHILAMSSHPHSTWEQVKKDASFKGSHTQKQWVPQQQLKRRDQQLWRPQRGLPERSVSVLRAWMFQNFLHPYPKDAEKDLLAVKSGLTRSQVSNWFINARVRLWKPMIEEMYAEMNQRQAGDNAAASTLRNHTRIVERRFPTDGLGFHK